MMVGAVYSLSPNQDCHIPVFSGCYTKVAHYERLSQVSLQIRDLLRMVFVQGSRFLNVAQAPQYANYMKEG